MRTSEEILTLQIHKKSVSELFNIVFSKNTKYYWFVLLDRQMIMEILDDDELLSQMTTDEINLLKSKVAVLEE